MNYLTPNFRPLEFKYQNRKKADYWLDRAIKYEELRKAPEAIAAAFNTALDYEMAANQ